MNKLHHRILILSNLSGLKYLNKRDDAHKNLPHVIYKLILEFNNKIEVIEYRTESERNDDYEKLQQKILKGAA